MEKFKKTLLFYFIGTVLVFWILALIRLNYVIAYDYFWYSLGPRICKNAIIYGALIGTISWMFLSYKFPTSPLNFKFIVNLFKPYFYNYSIVIMLAFFLVQAIQLHSYLFVADYLHATYYNTFGISVWLGVPMAVGYFTFKKTE